LTGGRKVPYVALITSAVIGVALVVLLGALRDEPDETTSDAMAAVAGQLLNIAVFGAVIAYVLQMVSFLILRRRFGDVPRPYTSPVGVPGAAIAGVIAAVTLVILPFNEAYRDVVIGVAIFFGIGLLYFAVVGRHKLVLSPEEEFALGHGHHVFGVEEGGPDHDAPR
jgi:ethanolamine permease